jgi:hypothetical protein
VTAADLPALLLGIFDHPGSCELADANQDGALDEADVDATIAAIFD